VRGGQGQPAPRRMQKVPTTVRTTIDRQITAMGDFNWARTTATRKHRPFADGSVNGSNRHTDILQARKECRRRAGKRALPHHAYACVGALRALIENSG
jgi:hypothetical protein